jgi:glycosyltransferase involved in cell wall biosynthesis
VGAEPMSFTTEPNHLPATRVADAVASDPRINLLEFLSVAGVGGTEIQVMNLIERLDPARFALRFACFRRQRQFLAPVEALKIPITEYPIKRLHGVRALKELGRLSGEIRRHDVDIVHSYNFYGNVFAVPAARLARAPVIVASIRNMGEMKASLQRLQRHVCRLADCVLTNADAIRRWLISEGYDGAKIAVIRNGLDVSKLRCTPEGGKRFRQEVALSPDTPLVAVLARLDPVKGIEYFLEAAAIAATRVPRARFAVVGESFFPEYRSELEAMAVRLGLAGRLLFTGVRSDVPDVLSQVAVSVLPSLSEGLSNTILESMAAGVPVVATRVGGTPEAVQDGETGLLVPARDAAALARAICLLLEDRELATRLGGAARQRVSERFGMERMVRETENLYLRLFEESRNGRRAAHGTTR